MKISLDFGGSTIDLVRWDGLGSGHIQNFVHDRSFETAQYPFSGDLAIFFRDAGISLDGVTEIAVTGGKSRVSSLAVDGVPVKHVDEIEAIGRGGAFLYERHARGVGGDVVVPKKFLVVSVGTGTCMTVFDAGQSGANRVRHLGGTGVGGGTFLGLSRLLLHENDPARLAELFSAGDRRKVDISVHEIVGGGIGRASGEMTASNLGKLSREIEFSSGDLADGIANLIGQTIGITSCFAARAEQCSDIIFIGKLTRIGQVMDIVRGVCDVYGFSCVVPEFADFGVAIGAGVVVQE